MFYDNLKSVCEQQGLKITPSVLNCGGTKGMISGWKNGAAPNSDIVVRLSVLLKVPTDRLLIGNSFVPTGVSQDQQQLLSYYGSVEDNDKIRILERAQTLAELAAEKEHQKHPLPIPIVEPEEDDVVIYDLYDVAASAGKGISIDYTSSEPYAVNREEADPCASFAVRVSGNSMEPRFYNDDIVLVQSTPTVNIGEVGIFILNGDAYIKERGKNCLISLNPEYDDIPIGEDDSIYCQGKILTVIPRKR